jgi:hypothetical protein
VRLNVNLPAHVTVSNVVKLEFFCEKILNLIAHHFVVTLKPNDVGKNLSSSKGQ